MVDILNQEFEFEDSWFKNYYFYSVKNKDKLSNIFIKFLKKDFSDINHLTPKSGRVNNDVLDGKSPSLFLSVLSSNNNEVVFCRGLKENSKGILNSFQQFSLMFDESRACDHLPLLFKLDLVGNFYLINNFVPQKYIFEINYGFRLEIESKEGNFSSLILPRKTTELIRSNNSVLDYLFVKSGVDLKTIRTYNLFKFSTYNLFNVIVN